VALLAGTIGLIAGGIGGFSGARLGQGAAVRGYLLAHPEVIPEAMAALQAHDVAGSIRAAGAALRTPFAGAWAGNPQGDVTLVMFTDYACGYCRASVTDIDRLLATDPRLKVVWREIPVLGPDSEVAAQVALAAAKQGRFPAFHRALFAAGRPDAANLAQAARDAGLDARKLQGDRAGADVRDEIARNLALAAQLKIDGTPAFVIGDQLLAGAVGYDRLVQAIAVARGG
jgi:protein-disulfide isomerase